jgi:hypothetical protein
MRYLEQLQLFEMAIIDCCSIIVMLSDRPKDRVAHLRRITTDPCKFENKKLIYRIIFGQNDEQYQIAFASILGS